VFAAEEDVSYQTQIGLEIQFRCGFFPQLSNPKTGLLPQIKGILAIFFRL
jgi:hypothetical protein